MRRNAKAKPNKSDFVRKQGDAPAKEVVSAAKKLGIKLTERYVYVIRSADKARARRKDIREVHFVKTGRGRGRGQPGGDERELRQAIAELGLARSRAILQDVERQLTA